MTLLLNGVPREIAAKTLAEALAELGFGGRIVATAMNGEFVPARRRAETCLSEGDRIEIVAPMQGG
ncbi:sulfur carrier protein ThiS [Bosea sp. (in: a-proteobacteria)]|uniref:sulfur carrier protein ThiS n=1 Tax=Bosea sp. (in: a-proteobacteria) TaxID=1871050 RepID=UPI0026068C0F|nr:sulfur carrier protein ThiS [Bosea sp. (in: a-proteobacteria)]MCO5092789.1 sulfur carrier protein ThiS [Bosea sp. (in: a-proteobacteria)]